MHKVVEPLYNENNGRPGVGPVFLMKMVLIQHLYGQPFLRRTAEEVYLNDACRFLTHQAKNPVCAAAWTGFFDRLKNLLAYY